MIQSKKQAKWRSLVSEQEASGQSIAAFCREREMHASLFHYWKKRLQETATPQFVEVQVAQPELRRYRPSFSFNRALTARGLARPPVACMT